MLGTAARLAKRRVANRRLYESRSIIRHTITSWVKLKGRPGRCLGSLGRMVAICADRGCILDQSAVGLNKDFNHTFHVSEIAGFGTSNSICAGKKRRLPIDWLGQLHSLLRAIDANLPTGIARVGALCAALRGCCIAGRGQSSLADAVFACFLAIVLTLRKR